MFKHLSVFEKIKLLVNDKSLIYHLFLTISGVVSRQFIKRRERKYLLNKLFIAKSLPSSQVSSLLIRQAEKLAAWG